MTQCKRFNKIIVSSQTFFGKIIFDAKGGSRAENLKFLQGFEASRTVFERQLPTEFHGQTIAALDNLIKSFFKIMELIESTNQSLYKDELYRMATRHGISSYTTLKPWKLSWKFWVVLSAILAAGTGLYFCK